MSFEKYKEDIAKLVKGGNLLQIAMQFSVFPDTKKQFNPETLAKIKLPDFSSTYQSWYSEALVCLSQLLPARVDDFTSYYKPARARKEIDYESYTISDFLQGLSITRGYEKEKVVGPDAALPKFQQQLNIVKALERRFESSLFDIRALVQADFFDNELEASEELNKNGFHRAAGALAGVVLEGHLRTACNQHKITVPKSAMLGKLNELLKENNVIDVATWRFIQHLTDLRNLSDHKLASDPTKVQIEELIAGVRKITKTVF
jgi:hypothetical protein